MEVSIFGAEEKFADRRTLGDRDREHVIRYGKVCGGFRIRPKSPGYLSVFVARRTIPDLLFIFWPALPISQSRQSLVSLPSPLFHYSLPESAPSMFRAHRV